MCGIFAVYSPLASLEVPLLARSGLFGLQHRGQESAGMAWLSANSGEIRLRKSRGLVAQSLDLKEGEYSLSKIAIAHCRYSTSGGVGLINAQPLRALCVQGQVALAHNGNISNVDTLKSELRHKGAIFQSTSDTEVILHLMAHRSDLLLEKAFIEAIKRIEGGYALVAIVNDKLMIARDSKGIRPLCFGKIGESFVVSSEGCAIEQMGGEIIRDVEPGEVILFNDNGYETLYQIRDSSRNICAFEYVYFARPDSQIDDRSVYNARINLGMALAKSAPADVDIVCGMPDSGRISAMGYARQLNVPFEEAILRNHFVGRSFILPDQDAREQAVRQKLRPVAESLKGKKMVIVDDSIVRGTTSKYIIHMLKDAGAKEVHMRVASPPVLWPCYYGIDMPSKEELAAANYSEEELCNMIGADSLKWLRLEDLEPSLCGDGKVCNACFTGNYLWEKTS
ncbi:MAG: amidophosphoribosyltransferase [Alphaproteobacteria bacterium]